MISPNIIPGIPDIRSYCIQCIRFVGVWRILGQCMVSATMDRGVGTGINNGEGTCYNCCGVCYMGLSVARKTSKSLVW